MRATRSPSVWARSLSKWFTSTLDLGDTHNMNTAQSLLTVFSQQVCASQQRSGEDGNIKQLHLAFSAGLLKESQLQTCAQFEHSCHHTPAWVLPDFLPVTTLQSETCYGVIMVCFYLTKPRGDTDAQKSAGCTDSLSPSAKKTANRYFHKEEYKSDTWRST